MSVTDVTVPQASFDRDKVQSCVGSCTSIKLYLAQHLARVGRRGEGERGDTHSINARTNVKERLNKQSKAKHDEPYLPCMPGATHPETKH